MVRGQRDLCFPAAPALPGGEGQGGEMLWSTQRHPALLLSEGPGLPLTRETLPALYLWEEHAGCDLGLMPAEAAVNCCWIINVYKLRNISEKRF